MEFEQFWREYPRKVGKLKAEKAWARHRLHHDSVMKGLALWKQSEDWRDPLFIPHASTFLNQRRWEDEPIVVTVRDSRDDPHRHPTPEQSEQSKRNIAEILKRHPDLA